MLKLRVVVTKVTKEEYTNQDNQRVRRAICEAKEYVADEGQYINRVTFTVYDAEADKIAENDLGDVQCNIARRTAKTRDGRDFVTNDVKVINWVPVTPETY